MMEISDPNKQFHGQTIIQSKNELTNNTTVVRMQSQQQQQRVTRPQLIRDVVRWQRPNIATTTATIAQACPQSNSVQSIVTSNIVHSLTQKNGLIVLKKTANNITIPNNIQPRFIAPKPNVSITVNPKSSYIHHASAQHENISGTYHQKPASSSFSDSVVSHNIQIIHNQTNISNPNSIGFENYRPQMTNSSVFQRNFNSNKTSNVGGQASPINNISNNITVQQNPALKSLDSVASNRIHTSSAITVKPTPVTQGTSPTQGYVLKHGSSVILQNPSVVRPVKVGQQQVLHHSSPAHLIKMSPTGSTSGAACQQQVLVVNRNMLPNGPNIITTSPSLVLLNPGLSSASSVVLAQSIPSTTASGGLSKAQYIPSVASNIQRPTYIVTNATKEFAGGGNHSSQVVNTIVNSGVANESCYKKVSAKSPVQQYPHSVIVQNASALNIPVSKLSNFNSSDCVTPIGSVNSLGLSGSTDQHNIPVVSLSSSGQLAHVAHTSPRSIDASISGSLLQKHNVNARTSLQTLKNQHYFVSETTEDSPPALATQHIVPTPIISPNSLQCTQPISNQLVADHKVHVLQQKSMSPSSSQHSTNVLQQCTNQSVITNNIDHNKQAANEFLGFTNTGQMVWIKRVSSAAPVSSGVNTNSVSVLVPRAAPVPDNNATLSRIVRTSETNVVTTEIKSNSAFQNLILQSNPSSLTVNSTTSSISDIKNDALESQQNSIMVMHNTANTMSGSNSVNSKQIESPNTDTMSSAELGTFDDGNSQCVNNEQTKVQNLQFLNDRITTNVIQEPVTSRSFHCNNSLALSTTIDIKSATDPHFDLVEDDSSHLFSQSLLVGKETVSELTSDNVGSGCESSVASEYSVMKSGILSSTLKSNDSNLNRMSTLDSFQNALGTASSVVDRSTTLQEIIIPAHSDNGQQIDLPCSITTEGDTSSALMDYPSESYLDNTAMFSPEENDTKDSSSDEYDNNDLEAAINCLNSVESETVTDSKYQENQEISRDVAKDNLQETNTIVMNVETDDDSSAIKKVDESLSDAESDVRNLNLINSETSASLANQTYNVADSNDLDKKMIEDENDFPGFNPEDVVKNHLTEKILPEADCYSDSSSPPLLCPVTGIFNKTRIPDTEKEDSFENTAPDNKEVEYDEHVTQEYDGDSERNIDETDEPSLKSENESVPCSNSSVIFSKPIDTNVNDISSTLCKTSGESQCDTTSKPKRKFKKRKSKRKLNKSKCSRGNKDDTSNKLKSDQQSSIKVDCYDFTDDSDVEGSSAVPANKFKTKKIETSVKYDSKSACYAVSGNSSNGQTGSGGDLGEQEDDVTLKRFKIRLSRLPEKETYVNSSCKDYSNKSTGKPNRKAKKSVSTLEKSEFVTKTELSKDHVPEGKIVKEETESKSLDGPENLESSVSSAESSKEISFCNYTLPNVNSSTDSEKKISIPSSPDSDDSLIFTKPGPKSRKVRPIIEDDDDDLLGKDEGSNDGFKDNSDVEHTSDMLGRYNLKQCSVNVTRMSIDLIGLQDIDRQMTYLESLEAELAQSEELEDGQGLSHDTDNGSDYGDASLVVSSQGYSSKVSTSSSATLVESGNDAAVESNHIAETLSGNSSNAKDDNQLHIVENHVDTSTAKSDMRVPVLKINLGQKVASGNVRRSSERESVTKNHNINNEASTISDENSKIANHKKCLPASDEHVNFKIRSGSDCLNDIANTLDLSEENDNVEVLRSGDHLPQNSSNDEKIVESPDDIEEDLLQPDSPLSLASLGSSDFEDLNSSSPTMNEEDYFCADPSMSSDAQFSGFDEFYEDIPTSPDLANSLDGEIEDHLDDDEDEENMDDEGIDFDDDGSTQDVPQNKLNMLSKQRSISAEVEEDPNSRSCADFNASEKGLSDDSHESDSDGEEDDDEEEDARDPPPVITKVPASYFEWKASRASVLKYQPPLEDSKDGDPQGNYPFSQSLRKIMQNIKSPGSVQKPVRRRMKITPVIPKSLAKPKFRSNNNVSSKVKSTVISKKKQPIKFSSSSNNIPNDTYIFSEADNEFVNLNTIVDKTHDQDTLDLLKELDNLDSDLEFDSSDRNKATEGNNSKEIGNENVESTLQKSKENNCGIKKYAPGPKSKKSSLVYQDCSAGRQYSSAASKKACPASKKRKLEDPGDVWEDELLGLYGEQNYLDFFSSSSGTAQPPKKKKKKSQKAYDCIDALNVVLKRRYGLVPVSQTSTRHHHTGDETKPALEVTVKDIKRVIALKKVKNFSDFKQSVLNYFKTGKECSPALKAFDVPNTVKTKQPVITFKAEGENTDAEPSDAADGPEKDGQNDGAESEDDIWVEAEREWDAITAKAKAELQEILRDARMRAAQTKKRMREAAEAVARRMASDPNFITSGKINQLPESHGSKLSKYIKKKLIKEYAQKQKGRGKNKQFEWNDASVYHSSIRASATGAMSDEGSEDEDKEGEEEEDGYLEEVHAKMEEGIQEKQLQEEESRKKMSILEDMENKFETEKEELDEDLEDDSDEDEEEEEEDEFEGVEPVDMNQYLQIDTLHGHKLEEGEPEVACTGTPFSDTVYHNITEAQQLSWEPRIKVKRLRYVHIVNKFCKRHRINLRAAFRIRRRLRYWEDRNDEMTLLELCKDSPRTLEEFLSHEVFGDAFLDANELKRLNNRKRIMIEFDRMKYWEEYDDDYDDDHTDRSLKTMTELSRILAASSSEHRDDNKLHGALSVPSMIGKPKSLIPNAGLNVPPLFHGTVVFNHEKKRYEVLPISSTASDALSSAAARCSRSAPSYQSQVAAAVAASASGTTIQNDQQHIVGAVKSVDNNTDTQKPTNIQVWAKDPNGHLVNIRQMHLPGGGPVKVVTKQDGTTYTTNNLEGYQLINYSTLSPASAAVHAAQEKQLQQQYRNFLQLKQQQKQRQEQQLQQKLQLQQQQKQQQQAQILEQQSQQRTQHSQPQHPQRSQESNLQQSQLLQQLQQQQQYKQHQELSQQHAQRLQQQHSRHMPPSLRHAYPNADHSTGHHHGSSQMRPPAPHSVNSQAHIPRHPLQGSLTAETLHPQRYDPRNPSFRAVAHPTASHPPPPRLQFGPRSRAPNQAQPHLHQGENHYQTSTPTHPPSKHPSSMQLQKAYHDQTYLQEHLLSNRQMSSNVASAPSNVYSRPEKNESNFDFASQIAMKRPPSYEEAISQMSHTKIADHRVSPSTDPRSSNSSSPAAALSPMSPPLYPIQRRGTSPGNLTPSPTSSIHTPPLSVKGPTPPPPLSLRGQTPPQYSMTQKNSSSAFQASGISSSPSRSPHTLSSASPGSPALNQLRNLLSSQHKPPTSQGTPPPPPPMLHMRGPSVKNPNHHSPHFRMPTPPPLHPMRAGRRLPCPSVPHRTPSLQQDAASRPPPPLTNNSPAVKDCIKTAALQQPAKLPNNALSVNNLVGHKVSKEPSEKEVPHAEVHVAQKSANSEVLTNKTGSSQGNESILRDILSSKPAQNKLISEKAANKNLEESGVSAVNGHPKAASKSGSSSGVTVAETSEASSNSGLRPKATGPPDDDPMSSFYDDSLDGRVSSNGNSHHSENEDSLDDSDGMFGMLLRDDEDNCETVTKSNIISDGDKNSESTRTEASVGSKSGEPLPKNSTENKERKRSFDIMSLLNDNGSSSSSASNQHASRDSVAKLHEPKKIKVEKASSSRNESSNSVDRASANCDSNKEKQTSTGITAAAVGGKDGPQGLIDAQSEITIKSESVSDSEDNDHQTIRLSSYSAGNKVSESSSVAPVNRTVATELASGSSEKTKTVEQKSESNLLDSIIMDTLNKSINKSSLAVTSISVSSTKDVSPSSLNSTSSSRPQRETEEEAAAMRGGAFNHPPLYKGVYDHHNLPSSSSSSRTEGPIITRVEGAGGVSIETAAALQPSASSARTLELTQQLQSQQQKWHEASLVQQQRRLLLLQQYVGVSTAGSLRDPDGETMLPFMPKEPMHCGRPDPDQQRTAAQVSPIVNVIRLALCAGYPPVEHHIRSAVYQLSLAWGICCRYHAIGLAEWHGLLSMLGLKSLPSRSSSEKVVMFTPPLVPSIPRPDSLTATSEGINRSLIIVERLVFAVDKRSREVFLPLPSWVESVKQLDFDLEGHLNMKCSGGSDGRPGTESRPSQPNPNSVELLTVLVSFTPSGQLLPGLVVFPGALMTYRLRHSLDGATGGRDWIIATRGGWRSKGGRCMLQTGEGTPPPASCYCDRASQNYSCTEEQYLENSDRGSIEEYLSRLVVGWGKAHLQAPLFLHLPQNYHYTITGKYSVGGGECCSNCRCKSSPEGVTTDASKLNSFCSKHHHQHVVPSTNRIVQDVGIVTSTHDCVSIILSERVSANWGVMVRQWTQKNGALLEHNFPPFLLYYLPIILKSSVVKRFAQIAGLDTFDRKKMERFNRHTDDYRRKWHWPNKAKLV